MSKRLPKTANRTMDDLRKAASAAIDGGPEAGPSNGSKKTAPATKKSTPSPKATLHSTSRQKPETNADDKTAQVNALEDEKSIPTEQVQSAHAQLIIERHANVGSVAGLIPLPWIDLAAISLVAERMLRKLAEHYGEPLSDNQSRRLATAMLTGMAAPGIASFTTTSLLRMVPGPNVVSMALTSVSANVLIRIIGETFAERLELKARTTDTE